MIALTLAAAAHAEPACSRDGALPTGPAQAWLWDGMLGLAQPVCPATTVAVGPRALLLADTPAFYGRIVASGTLEARLALSDRTAVGLTMEPAHYESTISALSSSWFGYGATTLTATQRVDEGGPVGLAMVGRLVLPTSIGLYGHAWPFSADLGLALQAEHGPWSAHGQAGLAATAGVGAGPTALATGLPLTLGGVWRPSGGFSTVLDLQSSFGYAAALDHLAVAPALRFGTGHFGMELGAAIPVAGENRTLTVVRVGAGARL